MCAMVAKKCYEIYWLIVWCLTPFSTVFQLYRGGQCTCPRFPVVRLTSSPHNILSKSLAAFPNNHCRNNGQHIGNGRKEGCTEVNQYTPNLLRSGGYIDEASISSSLNTHHIILRINKSNMYKI